MNIYFHAVPVSGDKHICAEHSSLLGRQLVLIGDTEAVGQQAETFAQRKQGFNDFFADLPVEHHNKRQARFIHIPERRKVRHKSSVTVINKAFARPIGRLDKRMIEV